MTKEKTFEELTKDKVSTVYEDFVEKGIRCRILRGPASLVAYLGINPKHLLAGKEYDDVPLHVHGGLTFSQEGKKNGNWPEGYYWYGWDYGHYGDVSFYNLEYHLSRMRGMKNHKWIVSEVKEEVIEAAWEMRKLLDLYASPLQRFLRWVKARLP